MLRPHHLPSDLKVLTSLILCVSITGCATFPQYRIGRVPAPVQVESCLSSEPLSVAIQYGNDEKMNDRQTPVLLRQAVEKIAEEVKGCFSSVTVSTGPVLAEKGVQLQLNLQLHNNLIKETSLGFISGFSFFTIPVWCTYPFTLSATASNTKGKQLSPLVLDDSVRLWMHALLLLYPKSPSSAARQMLENMVRLVFQKTDWKSLEN